MSSLTGLNPAVVLIDGIPSVSSLSVAEHFEKRHAHVIDAIREIVTQAPEEFSQPNFRLAKYTDEQGKSRPMYQLSHDGFSLVAMGFTGKKALDWKIRYIRAFRAMAEELARRLQQRPQPSPAPKAFAPIYFDGIPCATSKLLAQAYGCTVKRIQYIFYNHKKLFTEGKHYCLLVGEELRRFFKYAENLPLQNSPDARHLMLWLEPGMELHARMIRENQRKALPFPRRSAPTPDDSSLDAQLDRQFKEIRRLIVSAVKEVSHA